MASGGYTYKQMQDVVRLAMRRQLGDDCRYVDDLVPYTVNDAYHEIDRALRWTRCTYDITTVASDNEYIVPSSVREYLEVKYTTDSDSVRRLEPLSLDEWLEKQESSTSEGTPSYYIQHGDRVYLYPTPDTDGETLTIYVVGEPPRLAANDDKPGFPVHLHQLITRLACARLRQHVGDMEEGMAQELYVQQKIRQETMDAAMKRGGSGRVKYHGP
jgi:hypothetical protein